MRPFDEMTPVAAMLRAPSTEKYSAPPPAPPAALDSPSPPPEPQVTGANAEPYSHVPAAVLCAPPPPCEPPAPVPTPLGTHGPSADAKPPPFAEIKPSTTNEPLLEKDELPCVLIVEPDAMKNALAAPTDPAVNVHVVSVSESVLLEKTVDEEDRVNVLPPVKVPSETKTAKLFESVNDPPISARARV